MGEREEIEITAKDLTDAGVESAKKNLEGLGGAADKHSGALKGFTFAGKELGHQLGLSGGMSRLFGHELSDLATTAGTAGLAIGGLSLAVIAGYKIYEHFAEAKQKAYEETIKQGEASAGLINSLIDEATYTEDLTYKIRDLNERKREMASQDLEKGINAQKEKIKDLNKELEKGGDLVRNFHAYSFFGPLEESIEGTKNMFKEMREEIGKAQLKLDELELSRQKNQEGMNKDDPAVARMKLGFEIKSALYADNKKMLEDSKAMELAVQGALYADNKKMLEDDVSLKLQIQAVFYADNKKMLEDHNAEVYNATVQRMMWDDMETKAKQEALYNTAGFMSSSFQAMYQAGGAHARKSFSLFKMAASAEALINADRSAASAFAWGTSLGGPILGSALAALAYAAGIARVRSIRAMTLEGGGGAGGSSPTYSVSPTTGEPTGNAGSSGVRLTLIINGQTKDIGELTADVLHEIDRNNGIIGNIQMTYDRI